MYESLQDLEEESSDPDVPPRGIIDPFVELPPRNDYPDYYQLIRQPICMKQIETKINKKQYQSLKQFRQDIGLLCANCKQYNEDGSVLYNDANVIEVSLRILLQCKMLLTNQSHRTPSSTNSERRRQITPNGKTSTTHLLPPTVPRPAQCPASARRSRRSRASSLS